MVLFIHINPQTPTMDNQNKAISLNKIFFILTHVIIISMGCFMVWLVDTFFTLGEEFIKIWENEKIGYICNRFFWGFIVCVLMFLLLLFSSFFFSLSNYEKRGRLILYEFIILLSWHIIISIYAIYVFNEYYYQLIEWTSGR